AVGKADLGYEAGVVTRTDSWTTPAEAVRVEGAVVLRASDAGSPHECDDGEAFWEHIGLWFSPDDLLATLADDPCGLMPYLETGVRAYWCHLGGDPTRLRFQIGPRFAASIREHRYSRKSALRRGLPARHGIDRRRPPARGGRPSRADRQRWQRSHRDDQG